MYLVRVQLGEPGKREDTQMRIFFFYIVLSWTRTGWRQYVFEQCKSIGRKKLPEWQFFNPRPAEKATPHRSGVCKGATERSEALGASLWLSGQNLVSVSEQQILGTETEDCHGRKRPRNDMIGSAAQI